MAKTNTVEDKEKKADPFKDVRGTKMTALAFAKARGFSNVDQLAVKMMYGKDEKPFSYWEKVLKKDIVFN